MTSVFAELIHRARVQGLEPQRWEIPSYVKELVKTAAMFHDAGDMSHLRGVKIHWVGNGEVLTLVSAPGREVRMTPDK